jgi:hypothetical protein
MDTTEDTPMPPHRSRTLFGLALAAGFAWLAPASDARAQYSYGYDSFVSYPPSATFWYNAGYSGVYTDTSTGVFADGTQAPFRGVAPYSEPPYGQFNRSNGLPYVGRTTAPAAAAPPRPAVVNRRRGLLGRVRGR